MSDFYIAVSEVLAFVKCSIYAVLLNGWMNEWLTELMNEHMSSVLKGFVWLEWVQGKEGVNPSVYNSKKAIGGVLKKKNQVKALFKYISFI